ncbi:MAG: HD domain-containing protein [Deltaproteobacteria bacterium]|nr:HD domain-containing protein [Deltaproteobacteria bacterium]
MTLLTERFEQALTYTIRLHTSQRRKGKDVPYSAHLLSVAGLVLEHGGTEDEAIAALLHDAIEDQGGAETGKEISRLFGPEVATIVEGCSDTDQKPKPPWRERKEAYLAHLPHASDSIRLVSAADKLHNARSILTDYRALGEKLWPRFRAGREGTLWYFTQLAGIFSKHGPKSLAEDLQDVVSELDNRVNGA